MPPLRFNNFSKQASIIKNRLSTLYTQTTALATNQDTLSDPDVAKLKIINEEAKRKNEEFSSLLTRLFESDSDEKSLDVKEISQLQDEISDLYNQIQSQCTALTPADPNLNHSLPSTHSSLNESVGVRLPTLNLGTFSGQPEKWISFHSLFQSTVHNSTNLSDVEKFTYLISCLSGEPQNLIKSLPLTAENYAIAYDQLVKRYNNSRLLISIHINNLIDLPSMVNSSVKQLRSFICTLQENTRALAALGHDICKESIFLTSYVLRKFDSEFRIKFEHSRTDSQQVPNFKEFLNFLEKECNQLEAANLSVTSHKTNTHAVPQKSYAPHRPQQTQQHRSHGPQTPHPHVSNSKTALLTSSRNQYCTYCDTTTHSVYSCDSFLSLTPEERLKFVQSHSLCNNCLGKHSVRSCLSRRSCNTCNRRHHTTLHIDNYTPTHPNPVSNSATTNAKNAHPPNTKPQAKHTSNKNQPDDKSDTVTALAGFSRTSGKEHSVILGTTLIQLSTKHRTITARAVLDSAAQQSFMSEECATKLGAHYSRKTGTQIQGISSTNVNTKGVYNVTIRSLAGEELAQNHPVVILNKITNNLPTQALSAEVRSRMKHLVLGDPNFDTPAPVDVLIGADLFPYTLLGDTLSFGDNMPCALNTMFGYVLIGPSPIQKVNSSDSVNLLTISNHELHTAIQQFWQLENPPAASQLSSAEEDCELHFKNTHQRDSTGRYVCRLPFKENPSTLGNSASMAKTIFSSLERKFTSQPDLKKKYTAFMSDYRDSGHMKLCEKIPSDEQHYFLPHHGVLKDEKIRVVFNASAPTSTGVTLNNILHQGPKLQNEITDIILNFRLYKFVFSCDIKQMFRQIVIHEDDQRYQLIYWRDEPTGPIQVYQLTTVTYGMTSSPYIANKVVQQLVEDEGHNHPLASTFLRQQIFVDDALLGGNTEEEVTQLREDVVQLLQKGGFELRKWTSNCDTLLNSVPEDHLEKPLQFNTQDQPCFRVLGVKWIPKEDVFSYIINVPNTENTKRTVLSCIAKLYDPSGWLTPVTVWAKIFMQQLWTLGIAWNDPLPANLEEKWTQFLTQLPLLEKITIPRHLGYLTANHVQLHGFADSSISAYAACVYLRHMDDENKVTVRLLIAKSRVAPLKHVTLPRLELCAAHLLAKLLNYCSTQLHKYVNPNEIYAWSDSTITLSWISTPSYRLKVFVANRVAEIQELTPPCIWAHVSSKQNPADCSSRGISPTDLLSHPLWWSGPTWLQSPQKDWPSAPFKTTPLEFLPDVKPESTAALHVVKTSPASKLFTRFSSWTTLVHVTAYVLRFVRNCQNKITRKKKSSENSSQPQQEAFTSELRLQPQELDQATSCILRTVQLECFQTDIAALQRSTDITTSLSRLSPFLDENGLLRVGGRLSNSSLQYSAKHPVLLPKRHFITDLIIDYHHAKYLHCGPQQLQTLIAQRYWILSARSVIRSRIFKCIHCYRIKPTFNPPKMADLPEPRVTPTRAFLTSAVDFAGPFTAKLHNLRRLQHIKIYLCLFICMATKAIHLEVAMDLTAECFTACLTRFISRRGQVCNLYLDNATNFTGAARKIRDTMRTLLKEDPTMQNYLTQQRITFHFIPPRAPHFGGLWERAVQSAKKHMIKVIGAQVLTIEEFTTLICRVEAMLNSRPLTPMSSDPADLEVLTPGHFLTGGPLVTLPEINQLQIQTNRLKRWQLIQSFAQHIWKRWHTEYLHTLQNRPKWTHPQKNLKVGDLVLIQEDNVPPLHWKRGRVTKVIPGKDNIIRVAEVNTTSGLFKRPVVKLSLLPLE